MFSRRAEGFSLNPRYKEVTIAEAEKLLKKIAVC